MNEGNQELKENFKTLTKEIHLLKYKIFSKNQSFKT